MARATVRACGALVALLCACSSSSDHAPPHPTTAPTRGGCAPARPAPPNRPSYTLASRAYTLTIPSSYDGKTPTPMVLLIHGFGSSKEAIDADTGLDRLGRAQGYIIVTPDGSSEPRTWNFLSGASGSAADDFGFVDALLGDLEGQLCIDPARIYAAGNSAGSAFVGFLVCHQPYRFAAVAMVSATIPSTCPPTVTYAVLSIHGTADPVVLYNGGLGAGQTVPIPPVRQTVASLATRNSCDPHPVTDRPAPGVERLRYTMCTKGDDVELLSILSGGHSWPGGLQATHDAPVVPGERFSASTAILDFFATHPAHQP
jgi:polyhydroxybutyrate depolymerase